MNVESGNIARRNKIFRDIEFRFARCRQLFRGFEQFRQLPVDRDIDRFPQYFLCDAIGGGIMLKIEIFYHCRTNVAPVGRLAAMLFDKRGLHLVLIYRGQARQQCRLDEPLETLCEFFASGFVVCGLRQGRMAGLLEYIQHHWLHCAMVSISYVYASSPSYGLQVDQPSIRQANS